MRPLGEMFYATRPRAADVPGLCASDRVIVRFEPVGDTKRGAATPVHASGIESHTTYHFVILPTEKTGDAVVTDRGMESERCAALDPLNGGFFEARDEEVAVEGMWRFLTRLFKWVTRNADGG